MARPLAAAGSIAACIPKPGLNRANQREPRDYLGHGWGFAWPNDCRIIYNRASARPDGKPWSERKKLVWWDEEKSEWTGLDRPDFELEKQPDDPGDLRNGTGTEALPGDKPFILHADGVGVDLGQQRTEGRSAAHALRAAGIAVWQSAISAGADAIRRRRQRSVLTILMRSSRTTSASRYILTTYRLTEHHTAGGM